MVSLCHYLVALKYFTEVNQKFLITGHSFLLHVPEDVVSMIKTSKPSNPFEVLKMESQFLDFSPIERQIYKPPDVKISEARWIQFTCDEPTVMRMRKSHSTIENWTVSNIFKKPRGRASQHVSSVYHTVQPADISNLYPENLPVNPAKMADLQKLLDYLPAEKRTFYDSLFGTAM